MKKYSLIILFLLFTLRSCYYMDTNVYRVEITPTYNPITSITSTLDGVDSILTGDSLYFRYEIDIDTGRFYYSDLYLNNSQIARFDSIIDSVWIPKHYIEEEKLHEMTLVAFYKSYSGSLADRINAEVLVSDTTWLFTVYGVKIQ